MSTGSMPAPEAPLNPWFSMWTEPRRTMRQILAGGSEGMVILVAAIGGIARALGAASSGSLGADISLLDGLLFALAGAICGVILLWLTASVVHWTGDLFDGRGSPREVRAALAWPNVITAWTLPLCIPKFLLFRTQMGVWFLCIVIVETVVAIWAGVVSLKCLGEAQGYSAWKALGNMIVAALAIVIPLAFLGAVLTWLLW